MVSNDTFTPLLASEFNLGKGAYARNPRAAAAAHCPGHRQLNGGNNACRRPGSNGAHCDGLSATFGHRGTSVTLTGTGFAKVTAVLFNGIAASFQVLNATTIVAVVPTDATTGPVAVTNSTGTGTSAVSFEVKAGAVVTPPASTKGYQTLYTDTYPAAT